MNIENHALISFKDVSIGYGKKAVLQNINFNVFQNDFLGIIGSNGSGKTTLLKTILGLIKPFKGIVENHSHNIQYGYVIQRQFVDEVFPLTVKEIVSMGRYGKVGLFKQLNNCDKELVDKAMKTADVASLSNQPFRELSGGQRQRVLIARALASEANFFILDEPTNDLDIKGETLIMELIKKIHSEQNVTVIIVSHLLNNMVNYVNKLAFIKDSNILLQDVEEALTSQNLSNFFNCSVNVINVSGKKVIITNGSI